MNDSLLGFEKCNYMGWGMDEWKRKLKSLRWLSGWPALAVAFSAAVTVVLVMNNIDLDFDFGPKLSKYILIGMCGIVVYSSLVSASVLMRKEYQDLTVLLNARNVGVAIAEKLTKCGVDGASLGHDLDNVQLAASPLSTAYGIRAVLGCPDVAKNADLVGAYNYLVACQETGGWKASSQREPRPEVTADVLRSIRAVAGECSAYNNGLAALLASAGSDAACVENPYVASVVLMALPSFNSVQANKINQALVGGFNQSDKFTGHWCEVLGVTRQGGEPSVWATARALAALAAHPESASLDSNKAIARSALNYLASIESFGKETTQLVRQGTDGSEVLVPRHFTPALVTIAACSWWGVEGASKVAAVGIKGVADAFSNGAWRWTDRTAPVWMNAQAIEAINFYLSVSGRGAR
jgi:hypothetical protein